MCIRVDFERTNRLKREMPDVIKACKVYCLRSGHLKSPFMGVPVLSAGVVQSDRNVETGVNLSDVELSSTFVGHGIHVFLCNTPELEQVIQKGKPGREKLVVVEVTARKKYFVAAGSFPFLYTQNEDLFEDAAVFSEIEITEEEYKKATKSKAQK